MHSFQKAIGVIRWMIDGSGDCPDMENDYNAQMVLTFILMLGMCLFILGVSFGVARLFS